MLNRFTHLGLGLSLASRRSLASLGKPTSIPAAPGACALNEDWTALPLQSKSNINHDTVLFSFSLPEADRPLNLSTCACILTGTTDSDGELVVRPYTPISTNAQLGTVDLAVKVYVTNSPHPLRFWLTREH